MAVISFLSGKERSNDDTCNKTLFTRLNSLKNKAMRKISVHEREDLKIFLEKPFEFPKSAEELYDHRLQIERNQFDIHIRAHEKNVTAAKFKWEVISEENDSLKELLFEEGVLNKKAGLKCDELSEKLKYTEKQLEETCKYLQTLVTDGNAFKNEMKQMKITREQEIEKLKQQSDENNEMYINLLKSHKEMNIEVNENNKIIEALKDKLTKEIGKKRRHQKARSYYHSKIEKLANKNTFDLDSQIQELKDK